MSSSLTPIDISNISELVRIAEEVKNTKKSRVLMETAGKSKEKRGKTKADYEASLAALGSWSDLDPDALIAHAYRAREEGSRPATRA